MSGGIRGRRSRVVLAAWVAGLLTMAPAFAGAREPNEAAARFDAMAKKAYRAGLWDAAVAGFEAAHDADPLPRFLYNVGRAHEKRGDPAAAIDYYERYLIEAPDTEDRPALEAFIEVGRIKLKKTHGLLRVATDPPGALVMVELASGTLHRVSPVSRWVPAGAWQLRVAKEGFEIQRREVVVIPGAEAKVQIRMSPIAAPSPPPPPVAEVPLPAPPPPPVTTPAPPAPPPSPPPPVVVAEPAEARGPWLRWGLLGGGGALLLGGVVAGAQAADTLAARDEMVRDSATSDVPYRDYQREDSAARDQATVANVLMLSGGLVAAAGVYLVLQSSEDSAAASGSAMTLRLGLGGVALGGGFP